MSFKKYKEEILKDRRSEKLDFTPDGRNHYVYRVSKEEHYYGSKSELLGTIVETIGDGYFTSSKYLEESFKTNPEDYKIKIVRRFNNSADKILFESYLHQKFDVKNHDSFINGANQTPFGFDRTGVKANEETKKKMSLNSIKLNMEIAADPIRYAARSKKQSESMIKTNQEIASDPIRYAARSKKISEAAIITQAEIKVDLDRSKSRSKNQSIAFKKMWVELRKNLGKMKHRSKKISEASTKSNAKIKADVVRYTSKINKLSESAKKVHREIKADPIRASSYSKNSSEARLKAVNEYDMNGNFLREHRSRKDAADYVGLKNASGISQCILGKLPHAGGSVWKDTLEESLKYKENNAR